MPVAGLQMKATGGSGGGRSETPTMARRLFTPKAWLPGPPSVCEVDLYAVVPPQIGLRGGPTCGKDPPDDIARVVNAERLTNGSRWIEVGQRSRRVPFHCVEHAACVEGPADRRPVGVDRLREAGVASKVGKRLACQYRSAK